MEEVTDGDAALWRLLASPLDPVLSDPTRLRIQAALHALPAGAAMSFTMLRKALALTDGNLGKHMRVLIDAGFAGTDERWHGRRRTTLYHATSAGRAAFDAHVTALHTIIETASAETAGAETTGTETVGTETMGTETAGTPPVSPGRAD